ncbi:hypothetical protein EMEDMD4_420076 [Sinorhizobium medicae]|uniref:Uncharacterized protein n=1 Tax=Sinorhizobium medicae TaxID=110321 RepID=A0A508WZI3_9HYPH|nr:hypothetical protein EMEDMD4_420076 [Sinorhizobium medicae]
MPSTSRETDTAVSFVFRETWPVRLGVTSAIGLSCLRSDDFGPAWLSEQYPFGRWRRANTATLPRTRHRAAP